LSPDWPWVGDVTYADTYDTLIQAHAKALWIAAAHPRWIGNIDVITVSKAR
jgi:hypothetical protein